MSGISDYVSTDGQSKRTVDVKKEERCFHENETQMRKREKREEVEGELEKEEKSVKEEKSMERGEDSGEWRAKEETDWGGEDASGASTCQEADAPESQEGTMDGDPFEPDGVFEDEQSGIEMEPDATMMPVSDGVSHEDHTVQMFPDCALERGCYVPGDALIPIAIRKRNPVAGLISEPNDHAGGEPFREEKMRKDTTDGIAGKTPGI